MANTIFGNLSNPTSLSRKPFYSRFTEFENTDQNYILLGFTPGLALQAAELNEMQDNFNKFLTLSNTMMSNWTHECITTQDTTTSIIWDGVVPLSKSLVTRSGNILTFNIGWYYYTHVSGLRYWIHLGAAKTYDATADGNGFVRFNLSTNDIFSSSDTRLNDNSSGSYNTNSPGAYRIEHNITNISFQSSNINNSIIEKINGNYYFLNGIQI